MMQLPALRKHRFFSGSSEELLKNCAGSATTKKISESCNIKTATFVQYFLFPVAIVWE
jgi:hypothetical protein